MKSLFKKLGTAFSIALFTFCNSYSSFAALGTLVQKPLFLASPNANLILAIDDSGSMDSEVLFPNNDGALWWHTTRETYVGVKENGSDSSSTDSEYGRVSYNESGKANSSWKKFTYLFPNGTGSGNRVYSDSTNNHYAIPPFAQYAFSRASAFNKMYYDPNETYTHWSNEGSKAFGDMSSTAAESDPTVTGSKKLNLTEDKISMSNNWEFKTYTGMVIPKDTRYHDGGSWVTAGADITVPDGNVANNESIGVEYYPATYYNKTTASLAYSVDGTLGNCSSTPDPAHFTKFRNKPSTLSGVDALAPDGSCLTRVVIDSDITDSYSNDGSRSDCDDTSTCTYAEEIQNFANWFSYYRKRHLALRSGMGQAFTGVQSMRTGLFTINNRNDVTMRDLDITADKTLFFDNLYGIDGNGGGTPNRTALKHFSDQFGRTDNSAPVIAECQKNFALLFTDGFSTTSNEGVGNADANKGAPYEDNVSNTLADIAMAHYDTQLLGLTYTAGQVPVPDECSETPVDPQLDCNTDLHINTYTVGLGNLGTIYGVTHHNVADAYETTPEWPNVNASRDATQIDDLYHAAVNGRGEMFNAASATDLGSKLKRAINDISSKSASASSASVTSSRLTTGSTVYISKFTSGSWHGTIDAFTLKEDGNFLKLFDSGVSAAEELASKIIDNRVILTYNPDKTPEGVEFKWDGNLTTAMENDLNTGPDGLPDGLGAERLAYIRGDHAKEGTENGNFRERAVLSNGQTSRLGDIVHSSPVYVGEPNIGWPDDFPINNPSEPYSKFVSGYANGTKTRTSMVYAGANDGMLHGFDSETLKEKLAYIPSNLFSANTGEGLHYLTEQDYTHRYYVDLTPSVSDVFIKGEWHTILIGGQRAGGKGYFALDITNPDSFGAGDVMWEFTHEDLGYTYSQPQIGMMNNGKWVAIFGNGYNNAGSGEAELFIVDIETGDLIKQISTGAGTATNGLATPALADLDLNGTIDRAYAGDLEGNMWAFDLSGSISSSWVLDYKLFTTEAGEPITSKPTLSFHPTMPTIKEPTDKANEPNVMVFFGSGQYLVESDLVIDADTTDNYFYGVWDKSSVKVSSSDLVEQTITTETFSYTDSNENIVDVEYRLLTENPVDYTSKDGWKIKLKDDGERVITNPVVRGNVVYFNSSVPTANDPCSGGGYGYRFGVDLATGGATDKPVFDVDNNGIVDASDTNDAGETPSASYLESLPTDPTMTEDDVIQDGKIYDLQDLPSPKTGRFSWQELLR